ncbi:MAG: TIGR00296 family protein [Candidatus Diapherotrites archaeon]|uniref:Protein JW744_00500 n=1 Tax=Candidatus Iainarchaeum sp. TaxID=3101447 RepID=A0A938YW55_9ARCH|nr:TIGR00296 family protein [Candidatus Diapherotrites archaeon]
MSGEFSSADAKKLVSLARKSIEYYSAAGRFLSEPCEEKKFLEKRGVFVTLHTFPERELRGCIGFPYPVKPLWSAVIEAAAEAGFHDPRFEQVKASEMEKILVEISILTLPEKANAGDLPGKIEIGKNGLIVKRKYRSGLLLPQVAAEEGWDAETFLEHCCIKAGIPTNSWKLKGTDTFKFQAQVFSEKAPKGIVEEA